MEECTHDCSSCGASCGSREKTSMLEDPHALTHVKKVIGVVSGKGGVGKSIVTSMLAVLMRRRGYRTAILTRTSPAPPFRRRSVCIRTRRGPIRASSPC